MYASRDFQKYLHLNSLLVELLLRDSHADDNDLGWSL